MSAQSVLLPTQERTESTDPGALLEVLENETARCILETMGDHPVTASELSEDCVVPNSTLYRQLGELAEVGLVRTSVRVDPSGHHATQYSRAVSDITISLASEDGVRVELA